ncbi:MAG TPA: hypothetical protein VFB62_09210 [Polyangiaceae bacterium]|jgi:hypothetical protein|nr:hypothetical protein [Polyangiaceae bacterium]
MRRHWRRFLLAVSCLSALACKGAPPEPEHDPDGGSAPAASAPGDLHWKVPPGWNVERTADRGLYRAKYKISASGDAKHEAEVLVQRLGRGPKAEIAPKLKEFLESFEGPGSDEPSREKMKVRDLQIELVEVAATYKFPMMPPAGPKKKAMAHVLKEDWRGIAAGVNAGERGNWYFQMVGPNDSVAAAKSAFVSMLESLE